MINEDLITKFMLLLAAIISLLVTCSYATASSHYMLQIKNQYQIELPSHWIIHNKASVMNFAAAAEAIIGNYQTGKETLLAVSSESSKEPISKIRLSIESPKDFSSQDLQEATAEDLEDVRQEFINQFNLIKSNNFKVKHVYPVKLDNIDDHVSLLLHYERAGIADPNSIWHVYQYFIPMKGDYRFLFTLSYKESDSIYLEPIINRVKKSLKLLTL